MSHELQQLAHLHLADQCSEQFDGTLTQSKSRPSSPSELTIFPGSHSEFIITPGAHVVSPVIKHEYLANHDDPKFASTNLEEVPAIPQEPRKGKAFWMILFALVISFFMVVLEGAAVGNAAPTIASDLHVEQFAWIGTAYGLSSTALLPLSGGLAQV